MGAARLRAGSRTKLVDAGEARASAAAEDRGGADDGARRADAGGAGGGTLESTGAPTRRSAAGEPPPSRGNEQASFRAGGHEEVRGDAISRATGTGARSGDELRARQGASSLSLTAKHARVAADRQLVLMNAGGALVLDATGEAGFMLPRIRLSCGASQLTIGDGKIAISAPTVVARGAAGAVTLDARGASTTGKDVTSSAVMLNEIRGLPVIFSDSPGNTDGGRTP